AAVFEVACGEVELGGFEQQRSALLSVVRWCLSMGKLEEVSSGSWSAPESGVRCRGCEGGSRFPVSFGARGRTVTCSLLGIGDQLREFCVQCALAHWGQ